mgnify:CR=1 FL=1
MISRLELMYCLLIKLDKDKECEHILDLLSSIFTLENIKEAEQTLTSCRKIINESGDKLFHSVC